MAAKSRPAATATESKPSAGGSATGGPKASNSVAIAVIRRAGRVARCRVHERQQRGARDELERRVQHERVGRVLPGDGQDVGDVADQPGVGRVERRRKGVRDRHGG